MASRVSPVVAGRDGVARLPGGFDGGFELLRWTCRRRGRRLPAGLDDPDFSVRDELRPVRLQLELLKPELLMTEYGIDSTIVLFGGARIPEPARKDARAPKRWPSCPGSTTRPGVSRAS
jgi:hypothetical protein